MCFIPVWFLCLHDVSLSWVLLFPTICSLENLKLLKLDLERLMLLFCPRFVETIKTGI